ncbi:MAG: GGDEF domain-containing protein, partial [Desulfovibrionaceae bacterium]|nr:GGDEF domain-containing protein [Desulfovibrionaceae bacterium]
MGKGKASTIYLLTVFLLAALFVLNLSLFYGLLLDRQAPAENMTRLVYAVMILGLSVLAVQAALVFRSMIAKLDKDRNMAEELAERINQMTVLDELTKTLNRRKFETVIEREVENARRYKTLISGIMFDIDG